MHFVKEPTLQKGRHEMNVLYDLPEIHYDYNLGDKFSISLIPLEHTSFTTLNEFEDNAIRAYDSLLPNGYNRNPGNVMDRPIFENEDFEKAANLILDKIKGTEIFLTLTNNRKRLWYSIDLLSELGVQKNSVFAHNLAELIKHYQKANKSGVQKRKVSATKSKINEKPRTELSKEDNAYQADKDKFMDVLFKLMKYGVLICIFGMVVKWLLF
ncbi:hypothetical protein COF50_28285 [Bacillus toyonensis]|uniref:hypothetical protein n=2 Tax=Bacillaceae TaxID=186817 RepID=UPI00027BF9D5|nr:hypothetical protein [Bacillus toyonensis]KAB0443039.1 hypothetical protein CH334_26975 [Lysinibacillus sp. VIA-II-2016]MBJ7950323.1 hypothetical protein [Bacillus cereus group sp. N24]MBJ8133816.1 hypothetical protein [Bacillus cereus group sp. N3]EJV90134.1 hypothetical protein IGI_05477 [Bacillus toyonensis]EOP46256.1 hypothetical protein IKI_05210 [Bacillus toyonensis]